MVAWCGGMHLALVYWPCSSGLKATSGDCNATHSDMIQCSYLAATSTGSRIRLRRALELFPAPNSPNLQESRVAFLAEGFCFAKVVLLQGRQAWIWKGVICFDASLHGLNIRGVGEGAAPPFMCKHNARDSRLLRWVVVTSLTLCMSSNIHALVHAFP